MLKTVCAGTAILGLGSLLSAQDRIGLFLDPESGLPPLRIENIDMSVQIAGSQAITNLDFTFANQTDRVLEGEFVLPLSQGQSVYRLALDIKGAMREASIVDSGKGRQSFEQIVREGVDPALLEADKGNRYTTKIYPIPPNGTRRVSIGIEQTLTFQDGAYRFHFPLGFSGIIDDFQLSIESDSDEAPTAEIASPKINFVSSAEGHIAKLSQSAFHSGETLSIRVPVGKRQTFTTHVERDPKTGATYFIAELPHDSDEPIRPKTVSIFWDTSLSSLQRDLAAEGELLQRFLETCGAKSAELFTFALNQSEAIAFSNSQTGRQDLRARLAKLTYDGGTRYAALDFSQAKGDAILLFTDGISSLGNGKPTAPEVPLFTVNSLPAADHAFLESLCGETRGTYLNLSRLSSDQALDELGSLSPRLHATTVSGSVSDLEFGYRSDASGTLWLAGTLHSPIADLELRASGQKEAQRIQISKRSARDYNGLVQRSWARARFRGFDVFHPEMKKEASRFAQSHGIVTPLTSLIVLETVNDYARFDIEPPPELRKEYAKIIAERRSQEKQSRDELVENTVQQFQARIEWYETDFPEAPPEPVFEETKPRRPNPLDTVMPSPPATSGSYTTTGGDDEEIFELSPFEVDASNNSGYRATQTLAGARLRTELRDVGSTISVVTNQFLQDLGASASVGAKELLQYTSATEIGGIQANFSERSGSTKLANRSPDAPYYRELQQASDEALYPLYLKQRETHGATVGYFFDAATVFFERGFADRAALVLSNVCETRPGDELFLRAVGRRLLQFDAPQLALDALRETLWLRDFEPQSYFDLGLAYDAAGDPQRAIETLYETIAMDIEDRFEDIDLIAVMEINRILVRHDDLNTNFIDSRLVYPMPMDLRITLYWNTDDTDIDLWVTDPFGEKCYYSHNRTVTGGAMSDDVTAGYGPEEFIIRNAAAGEYRLQAHYYGSNEQGVELPPILSAVVTRNFSRPSEETRTLTVRLENVDNRVDIGGVQIGPRPN